MSHTPLDIAAVTDEISRSLPEALAYAQAWGITRYELREGEQRRFPHLTPDEIAAVEGALADGGRVTAVSPGIFKGAADDERRIREELHETLPRTIDLAQRFGCPLVIVFGFERYRGEQDANRARAQRAFEAAAAQAEQAGLRVAVENEPAFWVDRAPAAAALLDEIGHPALGLNWDPANLHWGGHRPTRADYDAVRPHLLNLHVKDYAPGRPEAPWRPVGEGIVPWADLLEWVQSDGVLDAVTLETHCTPLVESSRQSLVAIRDLLSATA